MLSYSERRSLFGDLSNNSSSDNLSLADKLTNIEEKRILSSRNWPFLEKQFTTETDSSNQFVVLPQYVDRVFTVTVTVDDRVYSPKECPSRAVWDRLNETSVSSDIPEWWFVYDGKVGLYPEPATSSNTITINGKRLAKDLTIADYTTGGVVTTVLDSATVTGTGTTWATSMAGRWLRITESDTDDKGDGFWYEILSVASTTSLTLVRPYKGTAITGGNAAYTISQCSLLPEQYQDLPIYGALRTYYTSVQPDNAKAQLYGGMYSQMEQSLIESYASKSESMVIDSGDDYQQSNPNLFIQL